MGRVKFSVNTEYAYLQNFKILQSKYLRRSLYVRSVQLTLFLQDAFTKHQIERSVPVESLIKCKMQDNLEFLQWSKRYWDQYYPGGEYDALARRKGAGGAPAAAAPTPVSSRTSGAGVGATSAARRGNTPTTSTTSAARGARQPTGGASAAVVVENTQLKQTVEGLERERDFYFSKLRDIELLLQQAVDQDPEIEKAEDGLVKHIQAILYSTEVRLGYPCFALLDPPALISMLYRKDLRYPQRQKVEWWMIRRRSRGKIETHEHRS